MKKNICLLFMAITLSCQAIGNDSFTFSRFAQFHGKAFNFVKNHPIATTISGICAGLGANSFFHGIKGIKNSHCYTKTPSIHQFTWSIAKRDIRYSGLFMAFSFCSTQLPYFGSFIKSHGKIQKEELF